MTPGICSAHREHNPSCSICCIYAVADDNQTAVYVIETSEGPMWALLSPAEEGLNGWSEPTIAHCLDIDVVAQGPSHRRAFELLVEAVQLCIDDDGAAQLHVRDRRTTPVEDWRQLAMVIKQARSRRWVEPQ